MHDTDFQAFQGHLTWSSRAHRDLSRGGHLYQDLAGTGRWMGRKNVCTLQLGGEMTGWKAHFYQSHVSVAVSGEKEDPCSWRTLCISFTPWRPVIWWVRGEGRREIALGWHGQGWARGVSQPHGSHQHTRRSHQLPPPVGACWWKKKKIPVIQWM